MTGVWVYPWILYWSCQPWLQSAMLSVDKRMNGPWALPGTGEVPCFLTWGAYVVRSVLGPSVLGEFANAMSAVDLLLTCVVARPMYVCTRRVSGGMCMTTAPMTPTSQCNRARGQYLCPRCAGSSGRARASDGDRLRVLFLYPLTGFDTRRDVAVRMKPFRAVVDAPPDTWAWVAPQADLPEPSEASPQWNLMASGNYWRYNTFDSNQIWRHAALFFGTQEEDTFATEERLLWPVRTLWNIVIVVIITS